ncbi:MAG TPA: exo-alpha-sialidase [Verrucomicrobiales bacterium]|nr:exo-alpha-sialidase [Verrucomicrobiales bacterium]HIL68383.1 exo-alpha-sialidase [Verrucomicrobiota bacterium]
MKLNSTILILVLSVIWFSHAVADPPALVKEKDIVIYSDDQFHSAFPSVVRRPDGELIVAFRRAPDRKVFGEKGTGHTSPNSYLVEVRSMDNGNTWTTAPSLILAHPFGGSQDPCMIQLTDESLLCTSYGWALPRGDNWKTWGNVVNAGDFVFFGGYLVRSTDGGNTWSQIILPPTLPGNDMKTVFNTPMPAYNRGSMYQGRSGRIFWAVARHVSGDDGRRRTENHLLTSDDGGLTWDYRSPIAQDPKVVFNEASIYETPKGDIVTFIRTANFDDHTVVARSTNGGDDFTWEDAGFQGHPHFPLKLPDGRVLLVYGYRHKPMGIRARILNAECTDYRDSIEIILREDGGGSDLGYPWATMMADGRILVCYYFNLGNGTRHIAGTILRLE